MGRPPHSYSGLFLGGVLLIGWRTPVIKTAAYPSVRILSGKRVLSTGPLCPACIRFKLRNGCQ
jgi:hypothetical protein